MEKVLILSNFIFSLLRKKIINEAKLKKIQYINILIGLTSAKVQEAIF